MMIRVMMIVIRVVVLPQVVVVGKALLPMDLMMVLSQPLMQVNGHSLNA